MAWRCNSSVASAVQSSYVNPLMRVYEKESDYIAVERFSRFKRGDWGVERGQVIYGLVIGNESKLT